MVRGARALARYGLPDTDAVRADLRAIGLLGRDLSPRGSSTVGPAGPAVSAPESPGPPSHPAPTPSDSADGHQSGRDRRSAGTDSEAKLGASVRDGTRHDAPQEVSASASGVTPSASTLLPAPTGAAAQALLAAISRAGRPELALRNLAGLVRSLHAAALNGAGDCAPGTARVSRDSADDLLAALGADIGIRGRLVGLLGASEPLGEHLVAHPETWTVIADTDPFETSPAAPTIDARLAGIEAASPSSHEGSPQALAAPPSTMPGPLTWADSRMRDALDTAIRDSAGRVLPAPRAIAPLRVAYRTQLAALAAADVAPTVEPGQSGPSVADVGRALADLADAVLSAALEVAQATHLSRSPVRLAVIAMGKSGARELNYVSDVDVLFVAEPHPDPAELGDANGEPAALRLATSWATEIMNVCRQVAWEVDAALRPEGGAGPLVRTIAGYRAYYGRWAKTWEFQALLKARPAAGDALLGEEFLAVAAPQVWTAAERADFVSDVQAMRRRVREAVPAPDRDRELKLSAGGLRDVEFAVQLLQMVHGRSDETLRSADTLSALHALTAGGYVGRLDGAELAAAYRFERRIEHLLQLQHLLRTHSLPTDPDEVEWLARTAGYRSGGSAADNASRRLAADLARHGSAVRRLHEKLFYRPLLAAVAAVPAEGLRLTPAEAEARLAALGFLAPDGALRHIAALTEGVSRRAAIQRTLLPVLLAMFADAPDPDMGLLGYRTVSDALADTPWYLRLLRDEGLVTSRLAALLGTSRLVADLLQRAPEVLRQLADGTELAGRDPAAASALAASALLVRAGRARTAALAAAAARSARRHELLRLASADLLGLAGDDVIAAGLSSIADATVRAALTAAHRQLDAERQTAGETLAARVAVIAMGRFGGAEMGYSSDADALFVAGPATSGADPARVIADATAIANLTTRLLSRPSPDPPLLIDTDLRPEGRGGPLVRTVDSYAQYWARNAEPWDRQALLRARAVDADDELAKAFLAAIDPIRYPEGGLTSAGAREIRRIKARVDTERLPRGADRTLHTKLGRGGLADVEWTIQLLQLQHAHDVPALRQTGTIPTIAAAVDAGLVSPADGFALIEGWTIATRARNAIMLVTGKPGDEIPVHGRVLAGIARALGYPADTDPGEFVDDYRRATRHARRAVDVLFDRP